ncbi:PREDICTED: vacuolar protein sorting-associated protein 51 homolog [Diuraphis noxia]|uniref:vacuolar protein sorting-associated protein 51 homolog n=1 Tax=Diuraphis noxia TaxID=143948 RepID=UPI000763AE27|nr:PREDICTED: vacuolar protein sorting-associated protein 51 homolog [Diuraphis noxia]
MQTLAYENCNKFILAADIIGKMKNDCKTIEGKMELLLLIHKEFLLRSNNCLCESHLNKLQVEDINQHSSNLLHGH